MPLSTSEISSCGKRIVPACQSASSNLTLHAISHIRIRLASMARGLARKLEQMKSSYDTFGRGSKNLLNEAFSKLSLAANEASRQRAKRSETKALIPVIGKRVA
eukprot:3558697-Amphidinium_carterae.1